MISGLRGRIPSVRLQVSAGVLVGMGREWSESKEWRGNGRGKREEMRKAFV